MKNLFRHLVALLCVFALCLTPVSALSVEDAIHLLEDQYVDPLPASVYEAKTLGEVFQALGDPFTYYMTAEKVKEFNDIVEKESTITGIGAGIEYTDDGVRIITLLDGGGAKDAGLVSGDLIIAVDGVSCVPASESARTLFMGEAGTQIDVTVRHTDGSVKHHTIERRTLVIHNTKSSIDGDIGIIDCDSFGSQTEEYFIEGINNYEADARLWVVDLRNNIGGVSDAAVSALGMFTGFGTKLHYREHDGKTTSTLYLAAPSTEKPVIVLVNEQSASAAELFAGGIRAENAGIVIGPRTYGKGVAQIIVNQLQYPDLFTDDALKVTKYRFYCADGATTDRIGVLPTIYVPDEYTGAVANLLTAKLPEESDYLCLTLNEHEFYVDLAQASAGENIEVLRELLAALPPDAKAAGVVNSVALPLESVYEQYPDIKPDSRAFNDVSDSPYATQINTLATYGILFGDESHHFNPNGTLTRAQLCAMIAQALNVTSRIGGIFSDVPDDSWYAGYVNAMSLLGFVSGLGDGTFDPNGTLTQEQFITVMGRLARFLNFHADDYALRLKDDELASDAALSQFASWARVGGSVLTQYGDMLYTDQLASIDPHASVTREQAAATMCNTLKTLHLLSY